MKNVFTKIGYIVIGSLLTLIGYHFGTVDNNTASAQKDDAIVDEIQCRRLVVVGNDGTPRIDLGSRVFDGVEAGYINIIGAGKLPSATMGSDAYGGSIAIFNSDLNQEAAIVQIATTEKGHGIVATIDKDGQLDNFVTSSPEEMVSFRSIGRYINKVYHAAVGVDDPRTPEPDRIEIESPAKTLRKGDKIPSFNSDDRNVTMYIAWDQSTIGEVKKNEIVFPPNGMGVIILKDGTRYTSPEGCTIRDWTIISGSLIVNKPK